VRRRGSQVPDLNFAAGSSEQNPAIARKTGGDNVVLVSAVDAGLKEQRFRRS